MQRQLITLVSILAAVLMMSSCSQVTSMTDPKKEDASAHFYFIQITDTHLGVNHNELRVQKTVEAINNLPIEIEFVAHTGDITEERLANEAVKKNTLSLLSKIKAPLHYAAGNHDITRRNRDITAQIFRDKFGELITQQEYNGVVCVFMYTEPLSKNFVFQDYKPLEELEVILKQSSGKPVIIFHHSPSVNDFYRNRMHAGWKQAVRQQWVELINRYNVKGVIAGHFHRDEHHWLGKVPLYVSSSVGDTLRRGRQTTYRVYEYKDGRIGYRTQYLKGNTQGVPGQ